jgi:hypothetical protein
MKRAKIMLMAIAVLAIVGGALAFKAKKFNMNVTVFGCTTTNLSAGPVTGCFLRIPLPHEYFTNVGGNVVLSSPTTTATHCIPEPPYTCLST